jgi:hypothetical protein
MMAFSSQSIITFARATAGAPSATNAAIIVSGIEHFGPPILAAGDRLLPSTRSRGQPAQVRCRESQCQALSQYVS